MKYPYNYVGVEFNVSELKAKLDDLIGKYGENFTIIVERADYETFFGEDYYVGMTTNGLDNWAQKMAFCSLQPSVMSVLRANFQSRKEV